MTLEEERSTAIPFEIADISHANPAVSLDPGITQELFFHNGLTVPVTVIYRSGTSITIPPSTRFNTMRDFVIRSGWRNTAGVIVDGATVSDEPDDDWRKESELIRQAILTSSNSRLGYGGALDYVVSPGDLRNNMGSLYLMQFDIVVTTEQRMDKRPLHPYSQMGLRSFMLANDDAIMGRERLQYGITIVDKQRRYGRRFVNLGGEVFAIQPTTESELADGVYLKTSGSVSNVGLPGKPRCIHIPFEQAKEKLGLYASVEEAVTLGNPKALDDRGQRELQAQGRRQEHEMRVRQREREEELEQLRFEQERREALHKGLELQLKDERLMLEHRRNLESLERKDYYEERSLQRKSSTEMVKYVPAFIAAISALAVYMSKRS